jgi:hypothetical protein
MLLGLLLVGCGDPGDKHDVLPLQPDGTAPGPSLVGPDSNLVADGGPAVVPPPPMAGREPQSAGPSGPLKRALYIVAHQDDDLNLMNPDMMNDLAQGAAVQTVYLTSGDAGFTCPAYTQGREAGVKVAYAQILAVPNVWDESELALPGKLIRLLSLRGTRLRLAFVGLHNSGLFERGLPDLEQLWNGKIPFAESRLYDGRSRSDRYTRAELIDTLAHIMAEFAATHINTLDSSGLQPLVWPFDHSDHVHSALFGLAAAQRYTAVPVGMYRAYNFAFEQENVAPALAATKLAAFQAYSRHDGKICNTPTTTICNMEAPCDDPSLYAGYDKRQYRVIVYQNVRGVLRGPMGQCLQADFSSARALLAPCEPMNPAQHWRVGTDQSVRHAYSALCLSVTPVVRGAPVGLSPCSGELGQRFVLTAHTQLRGPDATCVQAEGGRLTIEECTLDGRQLEWNPQPYRSVLSAIIEGIGEIPNALSYYGTLSFADLDADRDDDVCVRRRDGIYCAYNEATSFKEYALRLAAFDDARGWFLAPYGSTVQLGDIDGDGRADVCGRGEAGVYCAQFNSELRGFLNYGLRTTGDDFSDAKGYDRSAAYYRSLKLADVSGDGKADLCGRNTNGIECALSLGDGTFSAASQWTSGDFSDAQGWDRDSSGATLRYADIDGDRRIDVCGRTAKGIHCARNDGKGHFVDGHVWSFTGDFSDDAGWGSSLSYYGSIQLVDVDADQRADVCGRSPAGLVCGLSTSSGFSFARTLVTATSFNDRDGWSLDRYGSTLSFLDLDIDGSPDLCAWGPDPLGVVGLRCALSE